MPVPYQGTTKPILPFFVPLSGLQFLHLSREGLVAPQALRISGHSRTLEKDLSHPNSKGS